MDSSAPKHPKGSRSWRSRLAYQDDLRRKVLMTIRWQDGDAHTPEKDDDDFMATWGCYAVKYFDTKGEVWWGYFAMSPGSLSAKCLD